MTHLVESCAWVAEDHLSVRVEVVVVPRTLRESTEGTDWDIRAPLHWPTGQRASTWEPSWGEGPAVVDIPGSLIRVGGGEVP